MEKTKWVDRLKRRLGYPVVSISTPDETLNDFVLQSVERISPYARDLAYITGNGPVIDVSEEHILAVIRVIPSQNILTAPVTGVIDPFYTVNLWPTTGMQRRLVSILSMNLYRTEINAAIPQDYLYEDGKVYLSGYMGPVTVVAITEESIDKLPETYQQWCFDYSLALAKITEGEIRSKIKVPNAPVEMNGSELKQEGIQEKTKLEDRLGRELGIMYATR